MKRSTLILLKTLTWVACLGPMGLLVYQAATNTLGPDPISKLALTTGYNTLLLLILSLAITPVRRLSPRLNWLIKFRRLLGLFAFVYGTAHMLVYVALYSNFDVRAMLDDIAKRRFITIGVAAWLLLVPLALTDSLLVASETRRSESATAHCGAGSVAGGAAGVEPVAEADETTRLTSATSPMTVSGISLSA